jgi:glycosyltransferase involved in cell wall biosynthesis
MEKGKTVSRVSMLLSNPFRPDPRVLKEARSLAQLGHQITIIAWDRQGEYPIREQPAPGVLVQRVHGVPSLYGLGVRQMFRLPRFWQAALPTLESSQPELLHCHDFDTLPAGLWWGRWHRLPVVYDAHEYYADLAKPRLHGPAGRLLYHVIGAGDHYGARLASAVITVDETLGEIYRRTNRRVIIVGHYPPSDQAQQPSLAFTRKELQLLYVGRLSRDRGLLAYLEILEGLRRREIPARLCLAGVFTPAEEEKAFWEAAGELRSAIDYKGWVRYDQIPELIRSADLGLALLMPEPRYVAALPVKLFEYMAAGLPVVASHFPQISKVVQGSACGMVIDPLKPSQAVEGIQGWWREPLSARQAGENGRQAILNTYNWEHLVGQVDSLYHSLVSRPD